MGDKPRPPGEAAPLPLGTTENRNATRRITRTYHGMKALNTFALWHIVSINTLFMIDRGLSTVV